MLYARMGVVQSPHVLAQVLRLSSIAGQEVITGYGSHQTAIAQLKSGALADARFRIHRMAEEFLNRVTTPDEVREIQIHGHADREFRNRLRVTQEEDRVSLERAKDVWRELAVQIVTFPAPAGITPDLLRRMLLAAIGSRRLNVFVLGLGAKHPITNEIPGEANRRAEIVLRLTQSIPI